MTCQGEFCGLIDELGQPLNTCQTTIQRMSLTEQYNVQTASIVFVYKCQQFVLDDIEFTDEKRYSSGKLKVRYGKRYSVSMQFFYKQLTQLNVNQTSMHCKHLKENKNLCLKHFFQCSFLFPFFFGRLEPAIVAYYNLFI